MSFLLWSRPHKSVCCGSCDNNHLEKPRVSDSPTIMISSFHLLLISLLLSFCHAVIPDVNRPICVPASGPTNLGHCNEIISKQMTVTQNRNTRYTFSNALRTCDASLPAYLRRKNCLIIVNKLNGSLVASGSWADLLTAAATVVDSCVMRQNAAGGHIRMADGTYVAVWKPGRYITMLLSTGGSIPDCLRGVAPFGPAWDVGTIQKLRGRNESSGAD